MGGLSLAEILVESVIERIEVFVSVRIRLPNCPRQSLWLCRWIEHARYLRHVPQNLLLEFGREDIVDETHLNYLRIYRVVERVLGFVNSREEFKYAP